MFCRYKFQSSIGAYEDKTATLSDADYVWTEVRHMHMREAINKLMADFNKFIQDNAGFKGYVHVKFSCIAHLSNDTRSEGAANLNDMKDMLANLPQYQEQREKVLLFIASTILADSIVPPSSLCILTWHKNV
jgi:syntaxin-binding protein 1